MFASIGPSERTDEELKNAQENSREVLLSSEKKWEEKLLALQKKYQSQISIIGSNLINSDVSIQMSSAFYNSQLLIHNQLGQLVKIIDTTTDNQILTDVSNLSNGMYFITSSIKNYVNPIKFLKVN